MRLHFHIFCALSRVPFLALPYASKVRSMMQALELPPSSFVQEGRAGSLLASVDRLWDGRDERRRQLDEKVPEMQARSRRTVDLLLTALQPPSPVPGGGG